MSKSKTYDPQWLAFTGTMSAMDYHPNWVPRRRSGSLVGSLSTVLFVILLIAAELPG